MIPWGPLGAGFLTGKYQRGERAAGGLAHRRRRTRRSRRPTSAGRSSATSRVVDAAGAIAEERGATIPQVALAWLLGTPGVTAPIVGPRTFEQLEDLLGADGLQLGEDERARLEEPAGPPPMYPQRFLLEQNGIGDVPSVRRRAALTARS